MFKSQQVFRCISFSFDHEFQSGWELKNLSSEFFVVNIGNDLTNSLLKLIKVHGTEADVHSIFHSSPEI